MKVRLSQDSRAPGGLCEGTHLGDIHQLVHVSLLIFPTYKENKCGCVFLCRF